MGKMAEMFIPFAGGLLLGWIFWGGLYATVRRIPVAANPGLLMAGSLFLRMFVLLGGLYMLMAGDIIRLCLALAGVFAVKAVLTGQVRKRLGKRKKGETVS